MGSEIDGDLLRIKAFVSAAEAGRVAAKQGRTDNPFDGDSPFSESLRKAFHFGMTLEYGTDQLFSEVSLLDPHRISRPEVNSLH